MIMWSGGWRRGWVLGEQMQCRKDRRTGLAVHQRKGEAGGFGWVRDLIVTSERQSISCWRKCRARWRIHVTRRMMSKQ